MINKRHTVQFTHVIEVSEATQFIEVQQQFYS